MKIFKYTLQIRARQLVSLPIGAQILDVQDQDGRLCLWALVDEKELSEDRIFAIYGTGQDLLQSIGRYVATVQQDGFVWHVFEVELQ